MNNILIPLILIFITNKLIIIKKSWCKQLITSVYHSQTNGQCKRIIGQIVIRISNNSVSEYKNDRDMGENSVNDIKTAKE